ncbi:MAG: transcription elongation factor GreA [Lachnospiraceae bacterium]|nr:transcription elongation factor GreA [Lachnospiraceae bacterium]
MNNQLTKQDIADIEAEIEHRKVVVRKELLEHVKVARAHGDLSENFEYYAAKKEKNENESRIRYLERMIRTAQVVEDLTAQDEVGMNKTVTVRMEDTGEETTYKIVTTVRGSSMRGLISIESPVGKALLGHREGDRVTVQVNPSFSYDMTVLRVENTDLTEEDKIRDY